MLYFIKDMSGRGYSRFVIYNVFKKHVSIIVYVTVLSF